MSDNKNQRIGAVSNAHVGRDFEQIAQDYFAREEGRNLQKNHSLAIGVSDKKKIRNFDLGSAQEKIIVECKSHTWTSGDNVPSAKMTVWTESMFYFLLAPGEYRKILFVLKSYSPKRGQTLAEYYLEKYAHLIPPGVRIFEYDDETGSVRDMMDLA